MEHTNDAKIIKERQDSFLEATARKNAACMPDNLHNDFVFVTPKGVVLRKEPFINDLVLNAAVQLEIFESIGEEIIITGTTAISNAIINAKFRNKEPQKVRATFTFVYQNDHWQLLAMQETYIG